MSVTIRLEDDLDVGRGDLLGDPADLPVAARELEARICWMSEDPRAALATGDQGRDAVVAGDRGRDRLRRRHGDAGRRLPSGCS